jgi:multidrug efflux system membrane fusion protein
MKSNSPVIMRFVLSVAIALVTGCQTEQARSQKLETPVHIETINSFAPEVGLRYSASIVPYRQVTLSFRSGGFVDSILQVPGADGRNRNLGAGDAVKEGTILAQLRQKDYDLKVSERESQLEELRRSERAARSQLAAAEASAAKAADDFARASTLFATQSVTKPEYDTATAQRDVTRAQVEAARAQVEAAVARINTSEVTTGEANLDRADTQIAAAFDGYITQRHVEAGAFVAPGSPGFSIADLSSVKAVFGLPDREVANLRTGATLTVSTDVLAGREFRGTVTAISPVADSNTRLFPVEVVLPNPQRTLLAGMIVSLSLGLGKEKSLLAAPLAAVVRSKEPGGFAVVVVEEQGGQMRARLHPVTLGRTFGNRIEVTTGVRQGDRVVVSGPSMLNDGDTIRVIP